MSGSATTNATTTPSFSWWLGEADGWALWCFKKKRLKSRERERDTTRQKASQSAEKSVQLGSSGRGLGRPRQSCKERGEEAQKRWRGGGAMSEGDLRVDTSYVVGGGQHHRSVSALSDAHIMSSPMGKELLEGPVGGDFKYPDRLDQYDLRGSLYKKRGGWGKHLGWKLRAFTLYQGYLCYYESETLTDDVDRLKPRGVLNLNNKDTEPVSLYMNTHKAHDHAPTEWVFQLVGPVDHNNKWKLCAATKQEYDEWMGALSKLVGPALNPRATMGGGLDFRRDFETADDPTSPSPVIFNARPPPPANNSDGSVHHRHHHHRNQSRHGEPSHLPPPLEPKTDWGEVGIILAFTTMCLYWSRVVSWNSFCTIVVLVNLVVANALVKGKGGGGGKGGGKDKASVLARAVSLGGAGEAAGPGESPKVPSKLPPIGSTVEPASTSEKPPEHSWNNGRAENFKVRMGPNYRSTGRKEFSGPQMYRLLHLDIYKTPCKISHLGSLLEKLPDLPPIPDLPTSISAPRLFIVNCQLPSEAPSILSAAEDGPGYNVVFYFGLTPETAEALQNLATAPPAIRLLDEYFRIAPERPDFRGRFKAMAQVWNMKELGLPSAIEKFNGKPVLITKSGTLIRGRNYYEMDINVHRFGFPAKRGLFYLQERFKEIIFEVGFTIEGRDDSELPEVMLGVGQFNKIDVQKAFELSY